MLSKRFEIPMKYFNIYISKLISKNQLERVEFWFNRINTKDETFYYLLIRGYLKNKNFQKVENIINEMNEKEISIKINQFNYAIQKMLKQNEFKRVENLFKNLTQIIDRSSFTILAEKNLELNQLKKVEEIYLEMNERKIKLPTYQFNNFLKKFIKLNSDEKIEEFINRIYIHNGISYYILIHHFLESSNFDFVSQLLNEMIEKKIEIPVIQMNIFLKKLILNQQFNIVESIFKHIDYLDHFSYSILIQGYLESNKLKKVEETYNEMIKKNISILETQFTSFVLSMKSESQSLIVEKLFQKIENHELGTYIIFFYRFFESEEYDKIDVLLDKMYQQKIEMPIIHLTTYLKKMEELNKTEIIQKYIEIIKTNLSKD